jgi:hypothetical protein
MTLLQLTHTQYIQLQQILQKLQHIQKETFTKPPISTSLHSTSLHFLHFTLLNPLHSTSFYFIMICTPL